jgi:hypothetical protein
MACVDQSSGGINLPGGFTIPAGIGGFLTEWLPLILNVWLAYEMLDAAEEAESEMEKIAQVSLDASEELFEAYMELRDKDQAVYNFMNNQPLYTACNRDKHAIQAARQATQFLNETMGKVSRFDCGAKQGAVRAAQRAFIIGSMNEAETIRQRELTLEDQYLENHIDSITSAAYGQSPNQLSQAFGSAAALWGAQYQNANAEAAGSLAGVGYFGGRALYSLFG